MLGHPPERRLAGQEVIERGPEAVDVAGRAEPVDPPGRLLRAHVGPGADGAGPISVGSRPSPEAGRSVRRRSSTVGVGPAEELGQAPVHHQGLAVRSPSMMLAGFRSRWSTPRLCAYSIALQTSRNRPSRLRNSQFRSPGSLRGRLRAVEAVDAPP